MNLDPAPQASNGSFDVRLPTPPAAAEREATRVNGPRDVPAIVCVVVSNPASWFLPYARRLVRRLSPVAEARLLTAAEDVPDGNDIAFFLSYERRVGIDILARSEHNVVVHASALPRGKGMSPLTWQILGGENAIPLTLFEAVEALDAGPIYLGSEVRFCGHELLPEMRARVGAEIVRLCVRFVREYPQIAEEGHPQVGSESRYRTRTPEDSRLDPNETIAAQFNLLRVVDNRRYPAFFDLRGHRYVLSIRRAKTVVR